MESGELTRRLPVGEPRSLRDRDRTGRAGRRCRSRAACSDPRSKYSPIVTRRLHRLEGPVPLNAWLEQGDGDWRLVLFPRLTILAGLELGAGIHVNTLPPEEAAARLGSGLT